MICFSASNIFDEELQAQDLVERGEIDQAITIYQQLKPESAHIFYTIGVLYAEKKGDYDLAISCYEQALHMQGEVDIHRNKYNELDNIIKFWLSFCIDQ